MELITLTEHEYTITYNNQVNEDGQLGINVFLGKGFADEVYVTFLLHLTQFFLMEIHPINLHLLMMN